MHALIKSTLFFSILLLTNCITDFDPVESKNYIDPGNSTTFSKGIIILRNYDIEKGFTIPLFGSKGKLLDIIYPDKNFTDFISYSNEIYNNGNLKMYFNQIK